MSEPVRLQKLLAGWGLASRRTVETWIAAGRVKVDGETVADLGRKVDPASARIEIDGKPVVPPDGSQQPLVLVLNKPAGVVSTVSDPQGRPTVRDLLPPDRRLYPVGRLDMDSTGILLVTDFGELSNRLLHPRYKVEKEYLVEVSGASLSPDECRRFAAGLVLEDGLTAPCRIDRHGEGRYRVVLREGRKRQVKRMFEALDRRVLALHRERFGPIRLGKLVSGKTRPLTPEELQQLLLATGLEEGSEPSAEPVSPPTKGSAGTKGAARSGGLAKPSRER